MNEILPPIVTTGLSILTGAIITWYVAYVYYKKAGGELEEEARELRKLNVLMLRALEHAGLAEFSRDTTDAITGLVITLSGTDETAGKATGRVTDHEQ